VHEGTTERHALPHAARELEGILPLEAAESHHTEELAGALPERRELTLTS
jgi:hypothetical protein